MKKGPGSGWHKESERHSRARKYGSAGGSYKRRTNATRQKDESYCQRCSGPIDEPGLCGVCEAERLADEEFDMTSEVRPEDRAETWKYPADDRMEITRRNFQKRAYGDYKRYDFTWDKDEAEWIKKQETILGNKIIIKPVEDEDRGRGYILYKLIKGE